MHHDQEFTGPDAQLVAIVAFADDVAAKLGVTLNPGREISLLDTKGAKLLRLNDLELANLLVDIEDDIANFRAAF